jgi:hypothetical protein
MHASRLFISTFPSGMARTDRGQTSRQFPQPVHLPGKSERVTTFFKYVSVFIKPSSMNEK